MKVLRVIPIVLLVGVATTILLFRSPRSAETVAQPVAETPQPMEPAVLVSEPVVVSASVQTAEVPVEVRQPVQPLEERGDAMLSEIAELHGTPFGPEITMPFD